MKSVTALQFGADETVESILIGDSASWEVVKLKAGNVVSVKPILPSATTNMTIYTDRHVYTFELRSVGEFVAGAQETPLFRSIFTYPEDKKPKPESGGDVSSGAVPGDLIRADYVLSGYASFRPRWVQDNGRQTIFFLPEGAPRPAIFRVAENNREHLVNSRSRGNQVIVDGTSDYWVLRIGDLYVCAARSTAAQSGKTP